MTGIKYLHWCHDGCGKCVQYFAELGAKPYKCKRCGTQYTKEELDNWVIA